jgi:ABC-type branched-subunit amino acid transport system substrate-binding protein
MRHHILSLAILLVLSNVGLAAEATTNDQPAKQPTIPVNADTQKVLDEVNSLNAYQAPKLPLKTETRYANTAPELTPFRHVEPFKRHFLTQMEYTGAGRAIPEPKEVKTVRIGFLGPIYPTVSAATGGRSHEESMGQQMLRGCQIAIEEANAAGGYLARKVPFELMVTNDNGLWGSSGEEIIKMAYKQECWAMLGSIDGANSHIAIRVGLKCEIAMMNSGDTDPTFIETNIPWVFRCISDDRRQCYLLAEYFYRKLNLNRVGIIRASNRYGRFGVREIRDASRRLGKPIPVEMAYSMGTTDFTLQLDRLQAAKVEAVVHWGDATDGAAILNQMRSRGMSHPFFGGDRTLLKEFTDLAKENAEGVVSICPWDPSRQDPKLEAFRKSYREHFQEEPDTYAVHAYDGMNMLIWAIQVAGLNRAKIRDVLAYRTEPWPGISGDISLSAVLDDMGDVFLAKRENGQWKYYARDELNLPPLETAVRSAQTPAN